MNLTQDYEKLYQHVLQAKKQEAMRKWIQQVQSTFVIQRVKYTEIDSRYSYWTSPLLNPVSLAHKHLLFWHMSKKSPPCRLNRLPCLREFPLSNVVTWERYGSKLVVQSKSILPEQGQLVNAQA